MKNYNRLGKNPSRNTLLHYGVKVLPGVGYTPLSDFLKKYNCTYAQANKFVRKGWLSVIKLDHAYYHCYEICPDKIKGYFIT